GATLAAPLLESPMPSPKPFARPLRLYAIGHALMLFGAGVMQATGSMLPMALGASACLMLTFPLVRQFALRNSGGRHRL
ncbi:MAG: hypothetical protein ABIQ06_05230, partial [Caldimonas sp.]